VVDAEPDVDFVDPAASAADGTANPATMIDTSRARLRTSYLSDASGCSIAGVSGASR
jgi:hypothetical protein